MRGLGLMWAIEFGPPSGARGASLWDTVERRQPGLFSQLITVPLFHEHQHPLPGRGPSHERDQGAARRW